MMKVAGHRMFPYLTFYWFKLKDQTSYISSVFVLQPFSVCLSLSTFWSIYRFLHRPCLLTLLAVLVLACLSVCMYNVRPSVHATFCPFVHSSVCPSFRPSFGPSVCLPARLSFRPSVCLPVSLSLRPFVCPLHHSSTSRKYCTVSISNHVVS